MAKIIKPPSEPHHRFEWSPVLAGATLAIALTVVLMQFGAALGYSGNIDLENKDITHWSMISLGLWVLFVQLVSSLSGGYVAGYIRSVSPELSAHVNEMRDGFYGLLTWATSTVAVFIGVSVVAAVASLAANTPGTVETALALTETQENAAIIAAFALGATSVLSAATSWWAAVMAGQHRLNETDFGAKYSFLRK